jgi:hypothetical protein
MGKLQEGQGVIPLPANCMSQAIVDVSENMRAKIYSLYCKIGKQLVTFNVLCVLIFAKSFHNMVCLFMHKIAVPYTQNKILVNIGFDLTKIRKILSCISEWILYYLHQNLKMCYINIEAVFIITGFTDLPGLTVEDHITLTVIEKYLDFKVSCISWGKNSDRMSLHIHAFTGKKKLKIRSIN